MIDLITPQIECKNEIDLLAEKGYLTLPSYAGKDIFRYNKDKIARKGRVKEWEFYQIHSPSFVLQLTYGHVTYAADISATLIDLQSGARYTCGQTHFFPRGKYNLPFTGGKPYNISYSGKKFFLSFENCEKERKLTFNCQNPSFKIELVLDNCGDAMCYCMPFKKKMFYCNYKRFFKLLSGTIRVEGKTYCTDGATCLLDSGRGVWPYRHDWTWGMGEGFARGRRVGFNLGYGNSDRGKTNENMLFIEGLHQKLGRVEISRQKDFSKEWQFKEENGLLELTLTPRYDNFTQKNFLVIHNRCHQVFGYYNGFVKTRAGEIIIIENMWGFCEYAKNRW